MNTSAIQKRTYGPACFLGMVLLLSGDSARADSELISRPNIRGIHFSSRSSENGVCKALGYESAAQGAASHVYVTNTPMIRVDSEGSITGGDSGFSQIEEIVCIFTRRPASRPRLRIAKVNNPNFPRLRRGPSVKFSGASSETGVCRALGYESAAVGATGYEDVTDTHTVRVNREGTITSGSYARGTLIHEIICFGRLPRRLQQRAGLIRNPTHPISSLTFSSASNEHGICRALGYESAAQGATRYRIVANTPMIQVGRDGTITGGDRGSHYNQVQAIVCVN